MGCLLRSTTKSLVIFLWLEFTSVPEAVDYKNELCLCLIRISNSFMISDDAFLNDTTVTRIMFTVKTSFTREKYKRHNSYNKPIGPLLDCYIVFARSIICSSSWLHPLFYFLKYNNAPMIYQRQVLVHLLLRVSIRDWMPEPKGSKTIAVSPKLYFKAWS